MVHAGWLVSKSIPCMPPLITILKMYRSCPPFIFPSSRIYREICSGFEVRGCWGHNLELHFCNKECPDGRPQYPWNVLALQRWSGYRYLLGQQLQYKGLLHADFSMGCFFLFAAPGLPVCKFPQSTYNLITISRSSPQPYQTIIHPSF